MDLKHLADFPGHALLLGVAQFPVALLVFIEQGRNGGMIVFQQFDRVGCCRATRGLFGHGVVSLG
jgi:hypothetical protein